MRRLSRCRCQVHNFGRHLVSSLVRRLQEPVDLHLRPRNFGIGQGAQSVGSCSWRERSHTTGIELACTMIVCWRSVQEVLDMQMKEGNVGI